MNWRLIIDTPHDAFLNMGIDYALLKLNKIPTLRLYQWNPAAVSIGYFQGMAEEIDIEKCDSLGINYVRRITGGGAVFHDTELTYSLTIPEDNKYISKDLHKSYEEICGAVIKSLYLIEINAEYVPLNDIITNGKKISGCAQTRKEKKILQHGTMLIDVDVEKMFSILKVPNEKLKGKMISDVKERVTSINAVLGRNITFEELHEAFENGFAKYFNIRFEKTELTNEELTLGKKIAEEQFKCKTWNYLR
ncbi:MAG: biotin/lipoate A/B protein ligase family protein [archaeon]